ncbi:MAG TPA: glycosyltransferase family 4 protein [Dehalococcoidia bacterium]|nr:glycosyltransferase family 4 protein [Dehalococcoidia bacterium]
MRIGMIAPLEIRVPPTAYGGTELIVSLLTEELVKRGHDVTLFASGDSLTTAKLVPGSATFLRGSGRNSSILTMLSVLSCLERAHEFEVIHNHTGFEGLATANLVNTPVLTTLHGGLDGDWLLLFERYNGWYNTISHSARALLPETDNFAGVIYNAIDHETYPFNPGRREDYLLFLSRISPEKGTHLAIEVARRLGRRLIIAGNVDSVDEHYFKTQVEPEVDGRLIQYVGEADYDTKRRLFANASCLLAPLTWDEPFGLFMAEAMACGTPVIAIRRGSAPELVLHGETGFVVDDLDGMVEAVGRLHEISPYTCHERVAENFSVGRMTDDYLSLYQRIAGTNRASQRSFDQPLLPFLRPIRPVLLDNPFDGTAGTDTHGETVARQRS